MSGPTELKLQVVVSHMIWVLGSEVHYSLKSLSLDLGSKVNEHIVSFFILFSLSVSKSLWKLSFPYLLSDIKLLADFIC